MTYAYRNNSDAHRHKAQHDGRFLTEAFEAAVSKYDGALKTKPANGAKESRRELERRLNWLRERTAEQSK